MDICPVCGVAADVRLENGMTLHLCRNPQCPWFNKPLDTVKIEGGNHDGST